VNTNEFLWKQLALNTFDPIRSGSTNVDNDNDIDSIEDKEPIQHQLLRRSKTLSYISKHSPNYILHNPNRKATVFETLLDIIETAYCCDRQLPSKSCDAIIAAFDNTQHLYVRYAPTTDQSAHPMDWRQYLLEIYLGDAYKLLEDDSTIAKCRAHVYTKSKHYRCGPWQRTVPGDTLALDYESLGSLVHCVRFGLLDRHALYTWPISLESVSAHRVDPVLVDSKTYPFQEYLGKWVGFYAFIDYSQFQLQFDQRGDEFTAINEMDEVVSELMVQEITNVNDLGAFIGVGRSARRPHSIIQGKIEEFNGGRPGWKR